MEDSENQTSVLLLDLPPSALGGIDLLSFTTTPRFRGVKQLPPGFHFVFTSSTNSLSVRHGAWFHVKGTSVIPQLFIKKWDPANEELIEETDQAELLRWRANLGSIWGEGLTPYRQSASQDAAEEEGGDWLQLTDQITESLLSRIVGRDIDHWSLTSASSAEKDMDDIPGLSKTESAFQPEKALEFLQVDLKRTWRPGATGRERTNAAQDRSWALGDLVEHHCAGNEMHIIGELQFCFLMVLTLSNYSCLEQWKRILGLLFTCTSAIQERPELFIHTIALLKLQLQHSQDVEGGLFDMSDDGAALLKNLLRRFKKGMEQCAGTEKTDVMDELDELESYLKSEHGWDLDDSFLRRGMLELEDGEQVEMEVQGYDEEDESGEYAPVVVELTPAQAGALSGVTPLKSVLSVDEDEDEDEGNQDIEDMDARY